MNLCRGGTMKAVFTMILISAVLFYAAPLIAAGDAAAGKEIFKKKCASCHGTGGDGKVTIAKMLKVVVKHLGSKGGQAKSEAGLKKEILERGGQIKPVKEVDAQAAA